MDVIHKLQKQNKTVKLSEVSDYLKLPRPGVTRTVSFPLTTQGQLSAVGTIVSAGYGFICGAYMPISNFDSGLQ